MSTFASVAACVMILVFIVLAVCTCWMVRITLDLRALAHEMEIDQ